jgi:uncharacterized protein
MLEFEWDPDKESENSKKHGISFHEAQSAFADALSLTVQYPDHSEGEARHPLLARSSAGRLLVVSHTERGDRIRIISARRATRAEIKAYESGA